MKEDLASPDFSKASPGYRREVTDEDLGSSDYRKIWNEISGRGTKQGGMKKSRAGARRNEG